MTDKIDNNLTTRLAQAESKRVGSTAGTKAGNSATPARSGDQVKLTDVAQRLSVLEAQVNAAPDVREARVAELKQQIEAGEYAIDAARVADRLLESEASLLPLGSRQIDRNGF